MSAIALLANSTIKMSLVLAIALGLTALLRLPSAAFRHWVLAAAIACSAVMPLLEMLVPSWPVPFSALESLQAPARIVQPPARSNTAQPAPAGDREDTLARADPSTSTSIGWSDLEAAVRLIWLGGVVISLAILCIGLGRLRWLASGSRAVTHGRWCELADEISHAYRIQRRFVLLQSEHPSLLATWGLALPTIVLPSAAAQWSADRARIVLCHELAHIRRGDWIVQMAAELLRVFYWFNPLVWIVCHRLRLESEHACDDEVMSTGVEGTAYARHLVDLARALNQGRHAWFPAPAMARPSSLERRVLAMLSSQVNRNPIGGATRGVIIVLLLSVTVAIAAVQNVFQTFSGSVIDSTGRPVPGVVLLLTNPQRESKYEVKSNQFGAFEFLGLPSGTYALDVKAPGFVTVSEALTLKGQNIQRQFELQLGGLEETVTITVSEKETSAPVIKEAQAPDLSGCVPTSVGGRIVPPRKVRDLSPQYPAQLRGTGTEGTVVLTGRIAVDGFITDIETVGEAQPDLANAAVAAVREWKYSQTLLNCTPVDVLMTITTRFRAVPPASPVSPPSQPPR
jgi:beta-lactamase regulating signal transducer with metallopeptidase domain